MKLAKFLQITKAKRFEVFVYPKEHIKYNRGIDEVCTDIFEVKRNRMGKLLSRTSWSFIGDIRLQRLSIIQVALVL